MPAAIAIFILMHCMRLSGSFSARNRRGRNPYKNRSAPPQFPAGLVEGYG